MATKELTEKIEEPNKHKSRKRHLAPRYDFKEIEGKWQKRWQERGIYRTRQDAERPKYYYLDMFPYPSGELHMGHMRNYIIGDVVARYHYMRGYNVLHPMGYDAFGLPAENAAIQNRVHPAVWIERCIQNMRRQFDMLGISFDWEREVRTCEADYYGWNQWIFLRLYERGLAYKKPSPVNWCPSCETTLADEEAERGECWRCGSVVTKKWLEQWFFKTTAYAEQLLEDIDLLEHWPERVRTMQRNWIGKSVGVEFDLNVPDTGDVIRVFTTRIDTVFGMTFVVLAPEHPLTEKLANRSPRSAEVRAFLKKVQRETFEERTSAQVVKEGMFLDAYAINPVNDEPVPIWTANYVLMEYGTGAIMAVPAHDQRDLEFARQFGLNVRVVIQPPGLELDAETMSEAYVEPGIQVNSGRFDGMASEEAKEAIADWMEERGFGQRSVQYRLRDWLISRQRYWGCPIPIVYCLSCGVVPVPEEKLPVLLPKDVEMTGKDGSPLSRLAEFVNTSCPKCAKPARRETDTMTTFVDSSWYFLRYTSPHAKDAPFDDSAVNYWMPVDQYVGGIEHAVGHLMYSRFITKFLHDIGWLRFREPFSRLFTQGMIYHESYYCPECKVYRALKEVNRQKSEEEESVVRCAECGAVVVVTLDKMSKSKRNIVTPDELCARYGADTARLFILFIGPPEQDAPWSDEGVEGCYRFLNRLWRTILQNLDCYDSNWQTKLSTLIPNLCPASRSLRRKVHQTLRKVSEDVEGFHFNTAVAAMMELLNEIQSYMDVYVTQLEQCSEGEREERKIVSSEAVEHLIIMLHPFAPHISEQLWEQLGREGSVYEQPWREVDEDAARQEELTIVVQVNGKVRDRITVPTDAADEEIRQQALRCKGAQPFIQGKTIKRVIIVPQRLVNIVV